MDNDLINNRFTVKIDSNEEIKHQAIFFQNNWKNYFDTSDEISSIQDIISLLTEKHQKSYRKYVIYEKNEIMALALVKQNKNKSTNNQKYAILKVVTIKYLSFTSIPSAIFLLKTILNDYRNTEAEYVRLSYNHFVHSSIFDNLLKLSNNMFKCYKFRFMVPLTDQKSLNIRNHIDLVEKDHRLVVELYQNKIMEFLVDPVMKVLTLYHIERIRKGSMYLLSKVFSRVRSHYSEYNIIFDSDILSVTIREKDKFTISVVCNVLIRHHKHPEYMFGSFYFKL